MGPGCHNEVRWVTRLVVEVIQGELIRDYGGTPGLRDEHALEAALARAKHRRAHLPSADLPMLAAAYAYGLARGHPFLDGNKRIAFVTACVFLGLNGYAIEVPEVEVVEIMLALAAGRLEEAELAAWIRARMVGRPER